MQTSLEQKDGRMTEMQRRIEVIQVMEQYFPLVLFDLLYTVFITVEEYFSYWATVYKFF